MTVNTTKDPKGMTTTAPVSGHSCCEGDAATDSQSEIVKPGESATLGHAKPSKTAETCCCGGVREK